MENPYDDQSLGHYQEFLKSRERAMANLHRFFMDEQMAQYHLMMYTRTKRPNYEMEPPKREIAQRPYTPFPEDM